MTRLIFLTCLLLLAACGTDSNSNPDQANEAQKTTVDDGTAQMIKLLNEAHANIDPMKVPYHLNAIRAENFKLQIDQSTDINQKVTNRGRYGNELLCAGKVHDAILELESLVADLAKMNAPIATINTVNRLLAISYMRLGEEENCIGKNNRESCIIPIRGDGIYDLKRGPQTAISIYKKILETEPNDMETIWMLNIAYMTLGEYPNGVPAAFRIPAAVFESNGKVAPFKNISNQVNVATLALSGGSCIEDFNNDGLLDIMASSWGVNDQVRLFINSGNGNFEDKTESSGLLGLTGGLNMNHTDYNNDGFMDVFILRGGWYMDQGKIPNSLLENQGNGTFKDVTIEKGLLSYFPTQTATWADFNNDGWLDVFIGNESGTKIDAPCELYISDKGKFTNHTQEAGLGAIRGIVKGVTSGDINEDGLQDIYLSIMGQPNILMMHKGFLPNTNIPHFADITQQAAVGEPITSFPTWMWDFNNDGKLDIFAGSYDLGNAKAAATMAQHFLNRDYNPSEMHVYENKGNGRFEDVTRKMGITEPAFAMGSNYGDIDNDGFLDFYLGTGAPNFSAVVPNKMYRGDKGQSFQDVTSVARLGHTQKGHSVSLGDFDNDGDQDIFHVLGGAFEGDVFKDAFFENTNDNQHNWITIIAEGTTSNRAAIGALLRLTCSDDKGKKSVFYHRVSTGGSFGSNSLQQEIGLGNATKIDELQIKWPNANQTVEIYNNISPNKFVRVKEGSGKVEYLERKQFVF